MSDFSLSNASLLDTTSSPDSSGTPPPLKAALAVLGALGIVGIGIIIWWTMRTKVKDRLPFGDDTPVATATRSQRNANNANASISNAEGITNLIRTRSTWLKRSVSSKSKSLAAKVTPFNPNSPSALDSTKLHGGDGPRYVHTPGANMRIATRLSNGVWQFSEPVRGELGSATPFENASQVSLLGNSNPFSDAYASTSPVSPISPAENPFHDNTGTDRGSGPRRQTTADSSHSTTQARLYPFSRPAPSRSGTLPPGPVSVYRGTIYDLERSERGGPLAPAGIHDLEEDIVKNKGTPLPVMESELMRRGLSSANLLRAGSTSKSNAVHEAGLIRKKSTDTLATFGGARPLGRRPSAGSAVLLGGAGPVGVARARSRTMGVGTRTTTYHPDLDNVIDITTDGEKQGDKKPSKNGERESEGAANALASPVTDEQQYATAIPRDLGASEALPTPASGGIRQGRSPYRISEAFTSEPGHSLGHTDEYAPTSRFAGTITNTSFSSYASHTPQQPSVTSTFTTATSAYPHSVGAGTVTNKAKDKGDGNTLGISSTAIYLGSMTSLARPSFGDSVGRPSLSTSQQHRDNAVSDSDHHHYDAEQDPDATLYVDPEVYTEYPYSPSSTRFTHSHSPLQPEFGYGYGLGKENDRGKGKGYDRGLGMDDIDAVDESLYGYGHRHVQDEDEEIDASHTRRNRDGDGDVSGRRRQRPRPNSVDIVDIPDVPPPEYRSPRKVGFGPREGLEGKKSPS